MALLDVCAAPTKLSMSTLIGGGGGGGAVLTYGGHPLSNMSLEELKKLREMTPNEIHKMFNGEPVVPEPELEKVQPNSQTGEI